MMTAPAAFAKCRESLSQTAHGTSNESPLLTAAKTPVRNSEEGHLEI